MQEFIWPFGLVTKLLILTSALSPPCAEAQESSQCLPYPRTEEGYSIDLGPAMKGYNPFQANAFTMIGLDPGFKTGVIFDSSCDKDSKDYYADFLDVTLPLNCQQHFSSVLATSLSQYAKQSHQAVSFQDGSSFDVSASGWGFSAQASAKYAVNRDSSSNQAIKVMRSGKGEVITAGANCITHNVDIAGFTRKKFDRDFIEGLKFLNQSIRKTDQDRLRGYSRFTSNFGTHFIQQSYFGASMTYQKIFSERSKSTDSQQARESCFAESAEGCVGGGGGAFGVVVSANACINTAESKCKKGSESSLSSSSNTDSQLLVISRGSRPRETLSEWLSEKFQPYPVKVKLAPIVDLIISKNLGVSSEYGIDETLDIDGIRELLQWGNGLYCNRVLGLSEQECKEEIKGCGLSGNCPAGEVCFEEPSKPTGFICIRGNEVILEAGE